MKTDFPSRQQLESMSTADLISLADNYGIEIPDNLNRRFIIGELLEAFEEFSTSNDSSEELMEQEVSMPESLPSSYNETYIDLTLRNPAWAFIYWDISEADKTQMMNDESFENLFIQVAFYDSIDEQKYNDSFEVKLDFENFERYVLLPYNKKYLSVFLYSTYKDGTQNLLANTDKIEIPSESEEIQNMQPGKKADFSQLVWNSGLKSILHDHYINHRQSFSN